METATSIETVKFKLKDIILNDLDINVNEGEIQDNVSLYEDGIGLDSISIVNFIVLIESKFNISFTENEMDYNMFSSLDNLAAIISRKIN